MTRLSELATKAAEDLYNGVAPLSNSFLADNDVTLSEAFDLADRIANAVTVSEYLLRNAPEQWAHAYTMAKLEEAKA